MKKLFICALAVGMFTACSQEETLSTQAPMQISFDGAFVENASRAETAVDPSTTTETITGFDVWGYMDNQTGRIFGDGDNGEDVTGTKGNFTYTNTQFWYAGHKFYFSALAPLNSDNAEVTPPATNEDVFGLSNVNFTNVNGTEDLLYATYTRDIPSDANLAQYNGKVELTFSHLLSKVKFSFKNTYTNPNIHFTVYDINMTAPKKAKINLNYEDWKAKSTWTLDANNETTTLAFGTTGDIVQGGEQECTDERLTIPAGETQDYTVTFKVDLYNGGVKVNKVAYSHEITLNGVEFEMGKAYDIYAELNSENIIDPDDPNHEDEASYPIVFDVYEVEDWVAGDAFGLGQNVKNEEELTAAIAKGGVVNLTTDLNLTNILTVTKETTLNLNGKTLKNTNAKNDVINVSAGATLTINGEGTVEAITGQDGYAVISEGTLVINGGTFKAGIDANGDANAVIYARGNGKVYVNGGTFPNENNSGFVVNKKDADRATTVISVTGGTFTGFNPANNAAEGPGTNFVPSGYVSTETSTGVWTVTAEE